MTDKERMRLRIISNCRKTIVECEELIDDILWWNNNRHDEEPMDCEEDRVMLHWLKKVLKEFEAMEPL